MTDYQAPRGNADTLVSRRERESSQSTTLASRQESSQSTTLAPRQESSQSTLAPREESRTQQEYQNRMDEWYASCPGPVQTVLNIGNAFQTVSGWLKQVAGDPEKIASYGPKYVALGEDLRTISADVTRTSGSVQGWSGESYEAFMVKTKDFADKIEKAAQAVAGTEEILLACAQGCVEVANCICDLVMMFVKFLVKSWLAALASSGITFGGSVAAWLGANLAKGIEMVEKVVGAVQKLQDLIQKIAGLIQQVMEVVRKIQQVIQVIKGVFAAFESFKSGDILGGVQGLVGVAQQVPGLMNGTGTPGSGGLGELLGSGAGEGSGTEGLGSGRSGTEGLGSERSGSLTGGDSGTGDSGRSGTGDSGGSGTGDSGRPGTGGMAASGALGAAGSLIGGAGAGRWGRVAGAAVDLLTGSGQGAAAEGSGPTSGSGADRVPAGRVNDSTTGATDRGSAPGGSTSGTSTTDQGSASDGGERTSTGTTTDRGSVSDGTGQASDSAGSGTSTTDRGSAPSGTGQASDSAGSGTSTTDRGSASSGSSHSDSGTPTDRGSAPIRTGQASDSAGSGTSTTERGSVAGSSQGHSGTAAPATGQGSAGSGNVVSELTSLDQQSNEQILREGATKVADDAQGVWTAIRDAREAAKRNAPPSI